MNDRLTPDQVKEIVGHLGADRILEIIDTGANAGELVRAKLLAVQEDAPAAEESGLRTEIMHRLYDILRADLIEPEER